MDLGLAGRACIVTGAGGGIGRAVSTALAREGALVLAVGRDPDGLRGVVEEAGAVPLELDVTDPAAGERMTDRCRQEFGRVDVLVNNAGRSFVRPLLQLEDDDWEALWGLHVMAPMRAMRSAAPQMAAAGWGRIVNVGSIAGRMPSATNGAYSVSKAAVMSLSRAYADAFGPVGVLVNSVVPGTVSGPMYEGAGGIAEQLAELRGVSAAEVVAGAAARAPLGRFGSAAEIAAVVVFLCSELASNVAGAAWAVDGGAVPTVF